VLATGLIYKTIKNKKYMKQLRSEFFAKGSTSIKDKPNIVFQIKRDDINKIEKWSNKERCEAIKFTEEVIKRLNYFINELEYINSKTSSH